MNTALVPRVLALVGALLLGLVVLLPGQADAAPRKLDCGSNDNSSWCSYMTQNLENSRVYGYRDSISNSRNYAITGTCEASTSKTFTYTVGSTLGTEIKAGIFGGVKAEINASVAKSTTTGYVTSAEFKVPAHDTVYCDRGTVNETIKGYTKLSYCGGGCGTKKKTWSFKAPTRARWWIY
ncbi:hypothetical protein H5V45_16320 [Nocardioides sp. KIGAM211]|uniref:Uncharacterized protein n=1 Tax=Nocardioides luti TaxID=2761101 RepID=A0A7X0RKG7_9ACTN|nr:hypothetical protein [Nocardioides luti]MBB6628895.1 hypothetical protein [Nocardioides luti]